MQSAFGCVRVWTCLLHMESKRWRAMRRIGERQRAAENCGGNDMQLLCHISCIIFALLYAFKPPAPPPLPSPFISFSSNAPARLPPLNLSATFNIENERWHKCNQHALKASKRWKMEKSERWRVWWVGRWCGFPRHSDSVCNSPHTGIFESSKVRHWIKLGKLISALDIINTMMVGGGVLNEMRAVLT